MVRENPSGASITKAPKLQAGARLISTYEPLARKQNPRFSIAPTGPSPDDEAVGRLFPRDGDYGQQEVRGPPRASLEMMGGNLASVVECPSSPP